MATYFANATLFDGRGVRTRAGVLVMGGRIEWTGSHRRAPREARAAEEIDATDKTITPGLIDCHVHLCLDGSADFDAEARALNEPRAVVKSIRNARRHLEHGVTTVRDLGGVGVANCEVARAVEEGLVPGCRIVASGKALTITGGHGHNTFGMEVDGPHDVRRAVREQMRAGARSIKVIATGGVLTPGVSADFTAFTPEELEAAVDEAHKWGFPVAAHAIGARGIENAVRAGVDSIEHGSQISTELARLMRDRGTFHVPTISALRGIVENGDQGVPEYAVQKGLQVLGWARDSFRRTVRAGVRHACGTDAGTPFNSHGGAPHEIVRMVEWGLTPLKALQAATSNAAELLRLPEVGTIEQGKVADVVLYPGHALEQIETLLEPQLVMKAGEVAFAR